MINLDQLQNDAWITVTGKFTKGEYNGRPEPQIMVESITSAEPAKQLCIPILAPITFKNRRTA